MRRRGSRKAAARIAPRTSGRAVVMLEMKRGLVVQSGG